MTLDQKWIVFLKSSSKKRAVWEEMTREERSEAIRAGVAAGMSASQIAKKTGAKTRNIVIGFAYRYKIRLMRPVTSTDSNQRRSRRVKRPRPEDKSPSRSKVQPACPAASPVTTGIAADLGGVHIMDIGHGQCRFALWPHRMGVQSGKVSYEEAHFCGRTVRSGSSYCTEHHAVVWIKPKPRKRKDRESGVKVRDNSAAFR